MTCLIAPLNADTFNYWVSTQISPPQNIFFSSVGLAFIPAIVILCLLLDDGTLNKWGVSVFCLLLWALLALGVSEIDTAYNAQYVAMQNVGYAHLSPGQLFTLQKAINQC